MKRKFKWLFMAVLVFLSAGAYLYTALKPLDVVAEILLPSDLIASVFVQATVVPRSSSVVNAPGNGEILEFPGRVGTLLKSGTVAVRLGEGSTTDLEIQREQYRQQLTTSRQQYDALFGANGTAAAQETAALSQFKLAEKTYQNASALFTAGDIAQSELEALKTAWDVAKQQLAQAKEVNSDGNRAYYQELIASGEKQLKALEETGRAEEVSVPYEGIVWETYAKEGEFVTQNQPLFRIYRPDQKKLEASVLAEDAVLLREGMEAKIVFAGGFSTAGTISFVSQVASKETSRVGLEEYRCMVEVAPDKIPDTIGAGYLADVTFLLTAASDALSVPASALIPVNAQTGVYLIKEGKAVFTAVETGEKAGGRVEIRTGVEAGDQVITDPYGENLRQGSKVRIVEE